MLFTLLSSLLILAYEILTILERLAIIIIPILKIVKLRFREENLPRETWLVSESDFKPGQNGSRNDTLSRGVLHDDLDARALSRTTMFSIYRDTLLSSPLSSHPISVNTWCGLVSA